MNNSSTLYVIYHKKYLQYGFGEGHPFWPERAKEFIELLNTKGFEYELVEPEKASDEDILLAHGEDYLNRVKELAKNNGQLSIDTPVTNDNLEAAYYSVGGTEKALELALENKRVINLLGGLHHAERNDSSGFCIFNDHAIAIKKLQKENNKALIIDIDVHAGNGTQDIFYKDDTVLNISLHQDPTFFYPGTGFEDQKGEGQGEGFTVNVPLPSGTSHNDYLKAYDETMEKTKEFDTDIVIIIFGADTYKNDPLAGFNFELKTYQELASRMKKFEKLAVLCAGGYSKSVPEIWLAFIDSLVE